MKRFLRRVFWWDAPAQGAFFGLSLLGLGTYILSSVYFFFWVQGWGGWTFLPGWDGNFAGTLLVSGGILLVLYLFTFFLMGRFSFLLMRGGKKSWLWGLLPLIFSGKYWKTACGAMFCLVIGVAMLALPFGFIWAVPVIEKLNGSSPVPAHEFVAIQKFFGLSGYGWSLWVMIAFLLLLTWYLLTARLFAAWGGVSLRSMFGKPVIALWCGAGAVFLAYYLLVGVAAWNLERLIGTLENWLGHPLTATALGERYYYGDKSDGAFWHEVELADENDIFEGRWEVFYNSEVIVPESIMKHWRDRFTEVEPQVVRLEALFSGNIPPQEREYKNGELFLMLLPNLKIIRNFNRLELWRIRFALENKDIEGALAAWRRMGNANHSLERESFTICGLVWIACNAIQINALEQMLESGLLSTEQLEMLASELEVLEAAGPNVWERSLGGETVAVMELTEKIADGMIFCDDSSLKFEPLPLKTFRFFLPQLWWYFLEDQANMAADYREMFSKPFGEIWKKKENMSNRPLILSSWFESGSDSIGTKFTEHTARMRAARMLITAELYKRQYGDYPETITGGATDPFSGEPLLYRKGAVPRRYEVVTEKDETVDLYGNKVETKWKAEKREEFVPAVQVWSVGKDGRDSGGFRRYDDKRTMDDVRVMMRLPAATP